MPSRREAGLAERVLSGDRRALGRAITLVESSREADREAAEDLLARIMPRTGAAMRLGISGPPGVGKSTFIEAFGQHLIGRGCRVAVLAIDPSSRLSGGSVLADKTRMAELARRPEAYIRPSPAGDTAGGVAARTREAVLLCEAAGFDIVIVETVGVGQAETAVADMVDMLVLLVPPAGGDELQGIKRGIVELADLVLITKADGDLAAAAGRTAAAYQAALRLLRPLSPGWTPEVLQVSAPSGKGVSEAWAVVERYRSTMGEALGRRRAAQAGAALWSELGAELQARLKRHKGVRRRLGDLEAEVAAGRLAPMTAARRLIEVFLASEAAALRGSP